MPSDNWEDYEPFLDDIYSEQVTRPPGTRPYTIMAGDTLYRLAQRFGTTVRAIMDANPGIDPDRLRVGQVIYIPIRPGPGFPTRPPCPGIFERYSVRPGDTLWRIARDRGISISDILRYNPSIDPDRLRVGQILCLPPPRFPGAPPSAPPTCPPGFIRYTIQPGDTLWSIARRRGTTVDLILRYNPGILPNSLRVGQIICVP